MPKIVLRKNSKCSHHRLCRYPALTAFGRLSGDIRTFPSGNLFDALFGALGPAEAGFGVFAVLSGGLTPFAPSLGLLSALIVTFPACDGEGLGALLFCGLGFPTLLGTGEDLPPVLVADTLFAVFPVVDRPFDRPPVACPPAVDNPFDAPLAACAPVF